MNIYRQNRRLRRKPKVLPCSICEKIANTVEDWDQFIQENWSKGEIVVGSWQNYLEAAKHCSTCQRIVNYFQSDSDYVPFRPACKVMVMSHKETLWITAVSKIYLKPKLVYRMVDLPVCSTATTFSLCLVSRYLRLVYTLRKHLPRSHGAGTLRGPLSFNGTFHLRKR